MPPEKRITSEHIINIAENGNRVGFVTVICDAVTVRNEYGTLVFHRESGPGSDAGNPWSITLREAQPQTLPDGREIELQRIAPASFIGDPLAFVRAQASATKVFVDGERLDLIGKELKVSPVQAGDRFCPLGMGGHHRLVSDVLVDRKIPRRLRSGICKLSVSSNAQCDKETGSQERIVWVLGVLLDDRFKVSETTTSMFSIIVHETGTKERLHEV
ncbi:MAG: tRNA lysidine(34) synthetase TilS [Coriobacteriia bacterium]|nr:tRNA lysidine(34) synthetase TilS [Coriobacteriia bacterium]